MNLTYTCAEPADACVIFEQAKTLIDAYEDTASIAYDKVLAWVKRKIQTNISGYCCVRMDGEKVAYYRLCEDGELDDLYVLPSFQNRGIGSQILRKCIAESEKPLYLYVFTGNTRAIALYQRFGFHVRQTVGKTRLILSQNS